MSQRELCQWGLLIIGAAVVAGADAAQPRLGLSTVQTWGNGRAGRPHVLQGLRGGGLLVQGTPLPWEDSLQWLGFTHLTSPSLLPPS